MDWTVAERYSDSGRADQQQRVLEQRRLHGANRYGTARLDGIPSSTIVNELRFGWFKDRLYDPYNPALIPAQTGSLGISCQRTHPWARPQITIA